MKKIDPQPLLTPESQFRPLKIALLGYRSHPHVGGQGIYIKYLSKALTELGHHVDVFSGPPYPELDDGVKLIKVPSLDLYAHPAPHSALKWHHLRSWSNIVEWWSKLSGTFAEAYCFGRRLRHVLTPSDYDVIHDNQSLCHQLAKLNRIHPCVVTTLHHPIHRDRALAVDAQPTAFLKWLKKRWYNFLTMQEEVVQQLDNIVTVSSNSRDDIAECFGIDSSHLTVIGNGVDTQTFCVDNHVKRDAYQLITTASSDQPLKGLHILLAALATLKQTFPSIQLTVVGKLNADSPIKQQIETLGLDEHIHFVSGISTSALVKHYQRATIAITPSLYEGFGLPAIEAMACGTPVIASRAGALTEVVGNAGILSTAGDASELAKHIHHLLQHPETQRELSQKGREHVTQNYSWNRVALALSHYYLDILNRGNR